MDKIAKILNNIKSLGRTVLLENEVYEIFNHIGINTPKYIFLKNKEKITKVLENTDEVVVKVVSEEILHKTELGGVKFCKNDILEINKAIDEIYKLEKNYKIEGVLIVEKVKFKNSFGNELIVSVRNSKDFSTILGFGVGGIDTEIFGKNMRGAFSLISTDDDIKNITKESVIYNKISGKNREKKKLIEDKEVFDVLEKLKKLGTYFNFENDVIISECEINPIVISDGRLIAIDGLMKIEAKKTIKKNRPKKLENLFNPKSIAFIGVSEKSMNMGRIILNNVIKKGFDKNELFVIKPGSDFIDEIKCFPDVKSLPKKIDLLVLAVSAEMAGDVIKDSISEDKFESIILIPGGFAEKEGGEVLEQEINAMIEESRDSSSKGPIIVGGNCLGVISYPGNYDTFFIPPKKMNYSTPLPYAFISQSGAFIISKISKTALTPLYAASIGNQMDLTFSDYLSYFINKKDISVVAVYIEGFKELDGIKTARVIKELVKAGKKVIVYKGGRSSEGQSAASGHTASIAGDYAVYKSIIENSGAIVVESFSDFENTLKLTLMFKNIKPLNLGIISNAGFETVGMADSLGKLKLSNFSLETKEKIKNSLAKSKIDKLVAIHNPLDITPVAGDDIYIECMRAILEDKNVDFGVFSCIPMSPALKSIKEELEEKSLFARIDSLYEEIKKPFVFIVDSGELFDSACALIKKVPVFRASDEAIKVLNLI